ncbi:MAG: class I SAM-dependent methyltransferase, partial [Pseudomonadota bacterium]
MQSGAFLAVLMASVIFALIASRCFGFNIQLPVIALVILQALLAAIFSQLIGMASWWRWIHF